MEHKINLTKIKEYYNSYKNNKIDVKELIRLLHFVEINKTEKFLFYILKDYESFYKKHQKRFLNNDIDLYDYLSFYTDYNLIKTEGYLIRLYGGYLKWSSDEFFINFGFPMENLGPIVFFEDN